MRIDALYGPARSRVRGSSLIEVMIACLILMLLAIAAGAYFYHSRAGLLTAASRRIAIQAAEERLEAIRAAPFEDVEPPAHDYSLRYLSRSGEAWAYSSTDPHETVVVNGRPVALVTRAKYADAGGDSTPSYDMLDVTVEARCGANAAHVVALRTYFAP